MWTYILLFLFRKMYEIQIEIRKFLPYMQHKFQNWQHKVLSTSKKLIDLRKVSCIICSKKFSINSDYELYTQHKSKCCGNSVDQPNRCFNQIFNQTDGSDIPGNIEGATLHVIKKRSLNQTIIRLSSNLVVLG